MTVIVPDPSMIKIELTPSENWEQVPCSLAEETQAALMHRAGNHRFEICGFIVEENRIQPIVNSSVTPEKNFTMNRESLIQAQRYGEKITGIYHSHPSGRVGLTQSDEDGMRVLYRSGCPWRYFVVTSETVTEYRWIG